MLIMITHPYSYSWSSSYAIICGVVRVAIQVASWTCSRLWLRLREAENISWIKFLAHSSRILFCFFDKLSRFQCQCQCRFLQSYPISVPAPAVSALHSLQCLGPMQRRLYRRCAWRPLGIYHQHFASHLAPLSLPLSLSLYPTVSLSLSICRPRSQWRSQCRCSCRACVFFNGFLANVLGAAVGPGPSRSHEPPQLTFSCDVAWVMRPRLASLIKVSTIEKPKPHTR